MKKVRLGRTGLEVSAVGLGCGGHSRLGMAHGKSAEEAAGIVRRAIDLGITFIDTARSYGTEEAVGLAIAGRRDEVVLSTKALTAGWQTDEFLPASALRESVESSLRRLGTDRIDIFHLHAVIPPHYEHAIEVMLPEALRLKEEGKIRFLGITERFPQDTRHDVLVRALDEDRFDVVMVGFNLLNPSARKTVFPRTMARDVGTLVMFAVRRALSRPEALAPLIEELVAQGHLSGEAVAGGDPLAFLEGRPDIASRVEAAYRFCAHEPGAHVVLTGTGSPEHLAENIRSLSAPPLPADVAERLKELFGEVDSVSGN